jgi:hypothetical protein
VECFEHGEVRPPSANARFRGKTANTLTIVGGDEAELVGFEHLQAQAKSVSKARLEETCRPVADEISKAIAKLVPGEDRAAFL